MPSDRETIPYGAWPSPIKPAALVEGARKIELVRLSGDDVVWVEQHPEEGGRSALMRWSEMTGAVDLLPRWYDARSLVNSYGGGAMGVAGDTIVFSQHSAAAFPETGDQRPHRMEPGCLPVPITPAVQASFADYEIDARRGVVYAVMEEARVLTNGQPTQSLVVLDLAARALPRTIAEGADFYSAPRVSPDGRRLAWISWDYPSMPWEGTQLWCATIDPSGVVRDAHKVAGEPATRIDRALNPVLRKLMRFSDEAVMQPIWSPNGRLYCVTDGFATQGERWLNLARIEGDTLVPVTREAADFAGPPWQLGAASFGFVSETEVIAAMTRDGLWSLVRIDVRTGVVSPIEARFTSIGNVQVTSGAVIFVGASFTEPSGLHRLDLATGEVTCLRTTRPDLAPEIRACFAAPRAIRFPAGEGTAHAFHYAPRHPRVAGPEDEAPPLVVVIHGGPTAAARSALDLTIPFFTSRGFAVVDVNYRGSTGFGQSFRRAIYGAWGDVDVADCLGAIDALVEEGAADPYRIVSRGGSSGGYTTLALATFTDRLSAAASYYGISDLAMIARVTDKLEARYAELLVGPYPAAAKLFRERSPLYHADRIACPIILFQGTEDPVVPPEQARVLIEEMDARGLPHAFEFYEGEGHGFRNAATITCALEEELSFYGTMLGFTPAGPLKAPKIRGRGTDD